MILSRFFKPKWQHAKPEIRRQAISALASDDPALRQLAEHDPAPEVRQVALVRLGDLGLLQRIAQHDQSHEVRQQAQQRVRELMSGHTPPALSLDERLQQLVHLAPACRLYLVRHARESALRLKLMHMLEPQDEAILIECATQDEVAEVRTAAVERLQSEAALEQVARVLRNQDKRLYKQVRERLDQLQDKRLRRERAEQLAVELEQLAAGEGLPDLGRLAAIERDWQAQGEAAIAGLGERYQAARARILERAQRQSSELTRRRALCQRLEHALAQLEQGAALEALNTELNAVKHEWQQLNPNERAELQRYTDLSHQLRERLLEQQREQERAEHLVAICQEADKRLGQNNAVHERDISTLRQRWSTLPRPREFEALHSRFEGIMSRLQARLERQQNAKTQEQTELAQLVDELEQALDEGALNQALTIRDRFQQRLSQCIALNAAELQTLERRVRSCEPEIDKLRGWRRWGTQQAREQMCLAAEALISSELEPQVLAREVRQLRAAWKELDHQASAAPRNLWERFDKACNQAYKPAQAYFQAQTEARNAHRTQAEALCQDLEATIGAIDWHSPDWREVERLRRYAQERWQEIGDIDARDRRVLEKRFRNAFKPLLQQLDAERQRERQRRETLIQQLEALALGDDLREAVRFAKQAQSEWTPSVQLTRQQEQELWRRFRALCDAIFSRRQEQRDSADRERQTTLEQRHAICAQIDSLVPQLGQTPVLDTQLREQLQALLQQWQQLGPVPRNAQRTIERSYQTALERFESAWAQRGARTEQRRLDLLAQRHTLCIQMEELLAQDERGHCAALVEQWEQLPGNDDPDLPILQLRFNTARQALEAGGDVREGLLALLAAAAEDRLEQCLMLEILAGVESPADYSEARLRVQLSRLTATLSGREANTELHSEQATELERAWYRRGNPPGELGAELEQRFQHARAALRQIK